MSAADFTAEYEFDVGFKIAESVTTIPCTAGVHVQVADDVALLAAQPPITFPLAKNRTFPATFIEAVIVIALPFAAVRTPPVKEILIVAEPPPPPVTVKVKVAVSEPAKLFAVNVIARAVTVSVGVPDKRPVPVLNVIPAGRV